MTQLRLVYYLDATGTAPVLAWLERLNDRVAVARVRSRIDRLRGGNFGDCRAVGAGVSELRVHHGPGYRVYFGRSGRSLVVLLCAGAKASQRSDIERARRYWLGFRRIANERDSELS